MLEEAIIKIPPIMLALTVHEYAHALVSNYLGDPTPREQGRLTLNPFKHLSLLGTALFLFGPFGWAKPVQFSPDYFDDPKKGTALVALAGPLSNVIQAAIFLILLAIYGQNGPWMQMAKFGVIINTMIFVFNFMPIPPLDGSKILYFFLPSWVVSLSEKAGSVLLFTALIINFVWYPWFTNMFNPIMSFTNHLIVIVCR